MKILEFFLHYAIDHIMNNFMCWKMIGYLKYNIYINHHRRFAFKKIEKCYTKKVLHIPICNIVSSFIYVFVYIFFFPASSGLQ